MKRVVVSLVIMGVFLNSCADNGVVSVVVNAVKAEDEFRDYEQNAPASVREFYRLNHRYQTYDFVCQKIEQYCSLNHAKMSIWDALHALDSIVDESDPDLQAAQSLHAFQTAQALRADGHPRWLILTGFLHDLGKVLILFGEPQWAVVGDTFPVGCAYSDQVVFPEFFASNPDSKIPA